MEKIIECIPNFSEGRDKNKIAQIESNISKVAGIKVLNISSDIDHNRTVITFIGDPDAVTEAAFQAAKTAAKLINLNNHNGVHPRMGATDVIPLVPIKNVSEKECIKYARALGARIGIELKIPIYLYGKAAKKKSRENFSEIRNLGYEYIKENINKDSKLKPDYGPLKISTAGATALGVRKILIAYNINLDSKDIEIARKIAKKIREKDGGLKQVKALGFRIKSKNIVQVSMNLSDYKKTGLHKVFRAVEKQCEKYGVKIIESEIIGMVPKDSLTKTSKKDLKMKSFSNKQVLENTK